MSVEPLLAEIDKLYGPAAHSPAAAPGAGERTTPVPAPATWRSTAADEHLERQRGLHVAATSFTDTDDTVVKQLHTAGETVRTDKGRLAQIISAYRVNRARLASAPHTPQTAAMAAELDRTSLSQALDVARHTQTQLSTRLAGFDGDQLKDSPPATPLDSDSKWKPGDKHHMPYSAGKGGKGPPNLPDSPPWVDIYDRTKDPDQVPHYFVRSDEIPDYKMIPPGQLGPATVYDKNGNPDSYFELSPNSGVWVPQSAFPGAKFYPPGVTPDPLPPYGYEEWLPGSGIYMWYGDMVPETYNPNGPLLPPQTTPQRH